MTTKSRSLWIKIFSFNILLILFFTPLYLISQNIPDSIQNNLERMDDSEKVKYLSKLCWNLRDENNHLSVNYGKYALGIAEQIKDYHQIAQINNYLGIGALYYNFDLKLALSYFETAFRAAKMGNDSIELAFTYNNIGDVYFLSGNISLADAYADSSLMYFKKINFLPGLAYTYINLGQVYRAKGKFPESLEYLKQASRLHEELGIKVGVSAANLEIAKTYIEMQHYDSALMYFNKSLKLTDEMQNKTYHANSHTIVGKILYHQKKYSEALDNYNEALELTIERSSEYGIINNRIGRALVFSMIDRHKEGLIELQLATESADKLGIIPKIMDVKKAYIEFYENIGDIKKAYDLSRLLIVDYNSLMINNQFEILIEFQNSQNMSDDLQFISYELNAERKNGIYLLVILLLTVFLLFVLFLRYNSNRKMNNDLKVLNTGKDKLFSIISHDLRNPFIAIMNLIEILKIENVVPDDKIRFVEHVEKSTKSTYSLLENLLNLSAFRTGSFDFHPKTFSLGELLSKSKEILYNQLTLKDLDLIVACHIDEVYADKKMLEIILNNLLTNAIKYSHKGARIWVTANVTSKYYTISITDEGVGVSNKMKSEMFKSTLVNVELGTSGEKGTGIGLNLCQEFVEKHKGTIELKSTYGKGSEFIVNLPYKD